MKTTLGLKNFRVFDDKGANIHINPLTVLTGCNSSGKSSIVKALILLNEFLKGVRESAPGVEPRLEFDKKPLSLLGNFESILNKDAKEDRQITLSYTVDSLYLGNGITVELTFGTQENDIRKDGFLKEVSIKDADCSLLYHGNGYQGIRRFFPDNYAGEILGLPLPSFLFNEDTFDSIPVKSLKTRYFANHLITHVLDGYNRARTDYEETGNTSYSKLRSIVIGAHDYIREMAKQTDKALIFHAIDRYSKVRYQTDHRTLFKTDGELVERAMKSDIITYLPVLDILDSIPKDSFEERFRSMCEIDGQDTDNSDSQYRKRLVDSIVTEFITGDYRVFSDYYRSIEDDFLKEGRMMVHSEGSSRELAIPDSLVYKTLLATGLPVTLDDDELRPAPSRKAEEHTDLKEEVSLDKVFYLLTDIKGRPDDDGYIVRFKDPFIGIESRDHTILRDYMAFRHSAIKEVFTIDICNNLRYVGSNRIDIKRLYTIESHDNFSSTVSEYFEAMRLNKNNEQHKPGDFINKWIREFGIGHRFSIESLSDGIGLVLKVYRSEDDTEGRLLADFGYGISQLISILLEIETAVLKVEKHFVSDVVDFDKHTYNLGNLFSPNCVSLTPISIAIEEPEIHLHPRYQSLLADMFVDAYTNSGIHFIVETHSEYLIRKLQNHVAKGAIKPGVLSILYVEDGQDNEDKVRDIGIAEDGRLTSAFGPGFFDEADSLAMNLLKIKGGLA